MTNILNELAAHWPWIAFVGACASWALGFTLHGCALNAQEEPRAYKLAWMFLWPIVTPLWLLTLPARWLWRWLGKPRDVIMRSLETGKLVNFGPPVSMRQDAPAPKQPEKRAEETIQPLRITPADGPFKPAPMIEEAMRTYKYLVSGADYFPMLKASAAPADSKPDLPPYGSKVPEDGKLVTRAELRAEMTAHALDGVLDAGLGDANVRIADIQSRLAVLEGAKDGVRAWKWYDADSVVLQVGREEYDRIDGRWIHTRSLGDWGKTIGFAGCYELPHAEAVRLDQERRGQKTT